MNAKLSKFDRGIDFSGLKLPSLADPARAGARFIVRYSAGAASDPSHPSHETVAWKLCGMDELRDIVAAGYDFVANSEWTASRATEGGQAGARDGAADLKFWSDRGLAPGASIYVSWDTSQPSPDRHAKLARYLAAYERALGGTYHVDLYAGDIAISAMLDLGRIRYGWRAMADSWSGNGDFYQPGTRWKAEARRVARVSDAHVWQNGNRWFNGGADEDVILDLPIGSHNEALGGTLPGKPHKPGVVHPKHPHASHGEGAATTGIYTVRPGDTMFAIANRNGMKLSQLEKLNPHAGHPAGHFEVLEPGDLLTVRGSVGEVFEADGSIVHIVQPGDTLAGIARSWGVSRHELMQVNGHLAKLHVINPGDRVRHP
jgi:LysM repeat protein